MGHIITNAVSLFVMIILGYLTKRVGLLSKGDGTILSRIIINVTIPAVIVVNLATLQLSGQLLLLIPFALLLTLSQIGVGKLFAGKDTRQDQIFLLYTGSGFNIGNFTLPFVQSFYGAGVAILSIFDLGNSIMLAGGTTVVIDHLTGENEPPHLKSILKKLFTSPPFTFYLLMLFVRLMDLQLPLAWLTILKPVASANTFLSMFMIGLYLQLRLPRTSLKLVVKGLALRYGFGLVLVALFGLAPLPQSIKLILCLLAVTPVPLFSVIHSVSAGIKEEITGFCSSISFLISLPLMTVIVAFLSR